MNQKTSNNVNSINHINRDDANIQYSFLKTVLEESIPGYDHVHAYGEKYTIFHLKLQTE